MNFSYFFVTFSIYKSNFLNMENFDNIKKSLLIISTSLKTSNDIGMFTSSLKAFFLTSAGAFLEMDWLGTS